MIRIIYPSMKVPAWLGKVKCAAPYTFKFSCFGFIYTRNSAYIVKGLVGSCVMRLRPVKGGSLGDGVWIDGQSPDSICRAVVVCPPLIKWVDFGLYAGLAYLICVAG